MAERPTYKEFAVTVLRRGARDWHGHEGWFALAAYFTIIVLPLWATGLIGEVVGDVVERLIAVFATGWLFIYIVFIVPFFMWRDEKYRMNLVEEAGQPKINVSWRFQSNKFVELIFTNTSSKTLPRVNLSFRNYRKPDGSDIEDVLRDMVPVGGRGPSTKLDPLVQTFYRIASVRKGEGDNRFIELTPSDTDPIKIFDGEVGVKLAVSGEDLPGQPIDLRLTLNDDGSLSIEPWEVGEKAVRPAEVT